MELTPENKLIIDSKDYQQLLAAVRFAPIGDRWFQGETGDYWMKRIKELRNKPGGDTLHVQASKAIGW